MKSKNFRCYFWLDTELLTMNPLSPRRQLVWVKYFTADLRSGNDKWLTQQTFMDALVTHTTKLKITRGHCLIKRLQCRQCGHTAAATG